MSWKRLLTSPPPSTGWLLEAGLVAVARRDRRAGVQAVAAGLEVGGFEVGPVGLHAVDVEAVRTAVGSLHGRLGGARRAAVVVPTGWVRTHLLEFDSLPRRSEEVDEVVRWRLKKLLPVRPADLRIAAVPHAPAAGGRRTLLVMAGLERPFSELERAFVEAGVSPGLLTSRLYALGSRPNPAPARVVVQQEPGFLSLMVVADGVPRAVRTKPLAPNGGSWQPVALELRLGLAYIRESLELSGPLTVEVAADDAGLGEKLSAWWGEQEGVTVSSPDLSALPDPALVQRLGAARIATLLAPLGGLPS